VVSFAQITPNPYVWKANNPSKTVSRIGAAERGLPGVFSPRIGMQMTFRDSAGGVASTSSLIRFKTGSDNGWPIYFRSTDSRNCSAPEPLVGVPGGATLTLTINQASTTTLVFSRSVCRAFFIFCWGQLDTALDRIALEGMSR
jgi:hypothetical protein